jgi:hypothetical protein
LQTIHPKETHIGHSKEKILDSNSSTEAIELDVNELSVQFKNQVQQAELKSPVMLLT